MTHRYRSSLRQAALAAGLGLLLSAAVQAQTGPSAETLRSAQAAWAQQADEIRALKSELNALDILSDPDRDEQYWWNPFWRWSRENQSQRATEVALKIQELKNRQRDLEKTLQPLCQNFSDWALGQTSALPPAAAQLWLQSDSWRIPRLLAGPDWEVLAADLKSETDPELLSQRQQTLQSQKDTWVALQVYLAGYLQQPEPASVGQYQAWQDSLRKRLDNLSPVLDTLDLRLTIQATPVAPK